MQKISGILMTTENSAKIRTPNMKDFKGEVKLNGDF